MKKAVLLIVTVAAVISLSACAGRGNEKLSDVTDNIAGTEPIENVADRSDTETVNNADEEEHSRILIAYFTWAENTYVENPEAVDVDATTSASVLPPGNAAKMAGWIQEEIGGNLFSIVVTEPYSSDYDECLDRAADEKADHARPELLHHVENMEDYDIVFLGYPNWWASIPMPIASFLEEYDLSGKTIVPFCSHGGGRFGQSLTAIAKLAPDSTIGEGLAILYSGGSGMPSDVSAWLDKNNICQITSS
ncbi:MAG: flavodoxin [Lachnospiraceae bacterium]|nr:flavodoxin [Lachnospiraceae bacterium]MDE7178580.1 flavodoxin [Lachnospiraceae bacterium]